MIKYRALFIVIFLMPLLVAKRNQAPKVHDEAHKSPVVVFAHGLGSTPQRFKEALLLKLFPDYLLYGNTGPESTTGSFNRKKACFGQQADMEQVIAACEEVIEKHNAPEIIAFGFSKGSATWLNTLGYLSTSLDPKHKKILSCIKAVVVLAPFADLFEPDIWCGLFRSLSPLVKRVTPKHLFGAGKSLMGSLAKKLCPSYDPKGIHPIDSIEHIVPDVPIFIMHSTGDDIIPVNHSRKIYKKLIKNHERNQKKNTYLIEFSGGKHQESKNECDIWHKPMYDFLCKYGLKPHVKSSEQQAIDLSCWQPSEPEINTKVFKSSTMPSLAYGILLALGLEACKHLHHKENNANDTKSTVKRSLTYGAVLAISLEIIHQYRIKTIEG